MRRRTFLQVFAGLTLAAVPRVRAAGRRVAVVGGGILGASIAYHLVRRGADVTVVERGEPASGATANSFAWINATFSKQPWSYFELNRLGLEGYAHLDRELDGALQVRWGGSLEWHADAERARRFLEEIRAHQQWGYAVRPIDAAEVARLEPHVVPGEVAAGAHAEAEGHVDPVHATQVLIERASALGARVLTNTEVTALETPSGGARAVTTSSGAVEADVVVVACGVDTARVAGLAGLRVPLKDSPGVLAHTAPMRPLVDRVVVAPGAHFKQKPDRRLVIGGGFDPSSTTAPDELQAAGERLIREGERYVRELSGATLERVTLGWRPLPADDHPIVGFADAAPDVYVCVTHSGITLAPILGRLAAFEILDGVKVDILRPYRLSRFD